MFCGGMVDCSDKQNKNENDGIKFRKQDRNCNCNCNCNCCNHHRRGCNCCGYDYEDSRSRIQTSS